MIPVRRYCPTTSNYPLSIAKLHVLFSLFPYLGIEKVDYLSVVSFFRSIGSSIIAVLAVFAYCLFVVAGSIHSVTHHHGVHSTQVLPDLGDLHESDKSNPNSPEPQDEEPTDCFLCLQGKVYSAVADQSPFLELASEKGVFPTILPTFELSQTHSLPFLRAPPTT